MLKKYLVPSIFFVFAVIESVLGGYVLYEIVFRSSEYFSIPILIMDALSVLPVVYMTVSLIGMGIKLYNISTGKYGKVYGYKSKDILPLINNNTESIDVDSVLPKLSEKKILISKQSKSAKEIILYILSGFLFVLSILVSLYFSLSFVEFFDFEFVLFAIPFTLISYISFIFLFKAISETYFRKYSYLHKSLILYSLLQEKSST